MAETKRQWAYELSKCMTCGVCLEACPNVNDRNSFIGPAAISQVRLFNAHPTGEMNKEERLEALDGRWRHRRLRQLAELRALLPERHSAHDFDCRDEQGYNEAYVQEMAWHVVL